MSFNAFATTMPESARTFKNGDVCLKRDEYVKGEPMFGYYTPSDIGWSLERMFWKGAHATKYNWAKQQPNFKIPTPKKEVDFGVKVPDDIGSLTDRFPSNVINIRRG